MESFIIKAIVGFDCGKRQSYSSDDWFKARLWINNATKMRRVMSGRSYQVKFRSINGRGKTWTCHVFQTPFFLLWFSSARNEAKKFEGTNDFGWGELKWILLWARINVKRPRKFRIFWLVGLSVLCGLGFKIIFPWRVIWRIQFIKNFRIWNLKWSNTRTNEISLFERTWMCLSHVYTNGAYSNKNG